MAKISARGCRSLARYRVDAGPDHRRIFVLRSDGAILHAHKFVTRSEYCGTWTNGGNYSILGKLKPEIVKAGPDAMREAFERLTTRKWPQGYAVNDNGRRLATA